MKSVLKVSLRHALFGTVAMVAVSLSGCATQRAVSEMNQSVSTKANQDFEASRQPLTPAATFQVDKGFYAARKPIDVTPVNGSTSLPSSFYRPTRVAIQNRVTLQELAANISSGSGIRVGISPDVLSPTGNAAGGAGLAAGGSLGSASNPTAAPPSALPPLPGGEGGAGAFPTSVPTATGDGSVQGLNLNGLQFEGNFVGLLDTITGKLNLSWRYDGAQILIYRYETRMFRLNALAGDSTVNATLSTKAQSGGSGGGGAAGGSGGLSGNSGQDTTVNSKMDIWKDVESTIKASLPKGDGSSYSLVPSAGLVTIKSTPTVLAEIEAQMKEFNRIYSRSVMLKVDVYAVENNHGDDYGLDWGLFWKKANGFGLSLASSGNTASNGASIGPSFTFSKVGGALDGSNIVAAMNSTLGNTSLVTSATAITLNGQTVPFNVSREQAYLQSYSTTLNGGTSGTSTTTLTPGVVQEGFSMNFTPRILDGNNVMMRYAVDLSNIEQITTFTSPDGLSAIQLPSRSVRNFLQNVNIHSGDSLLLTGFQQVQGKDNSSGPFSAKAWFAGGRRTTSALNRTIVIIVTPYITQQ